MENTSMINKAKFETILAGLIQRYQDRVQAVGKILIAMKAHQMIDQIHDIENDHIAFRTLGLPFLGIQSLEKIFLHYGYQKKDKYHFTQKKLDAYWYAPPYPHWPRIFISELRVQELSDRSQAIIQKYTQSIQSDSIHHINMDESESVIEWLHQSQWPVPSKADYQYLLSENEYTAWVIYNRYYLNHFTIAIHQLPAPYHDLKVFNEFIENLGIKLNTSGGKIKTSADGLLSQSSTIAELVEAKFADGKTLMIPGSYVEFAHRAVLPEYQHLPPEKITRQHRRDGFETDNADKIFESTYTQKK